MYSTSEYMCSRNKSSKYFGNEAIFLFNYSLELLDLLSAKIFKRNLIKSTVVAQINQFIFI